MIKNSTKCISALNIDGNLISIHVVDHFKKLFSNPVDSDIDNNFINDSIPNLISQDTNQMLVKVPTAIRNQRSLILTMMVLLYAGFGVFFFQHYWDIIHEDVLFVLGFCLIITLIL